MTETTDPMREYARALFADPDEPQPAPSDESDQEPTRSNVVPGEGRNVPPPGDDLHDFARRLFGYDD